MGTFGECVARVLPKITEMRSYVTLAILTCVNLLNYMDRYSVAGVLLKVKMFYSISDTETGLMTTIFILSYMLFSPVFGYMGDRWNRKFIMACGIAFWSIATIASSLIGQNGFYIFLFLRALLGIGEASYTTIAPTVIADHFSGSSRTKALSIYFFAIPLGSGLGYIVGSEVANIFGDWRWALRVTPILGFICSALVCVCVNEPSRGAADKSSYLEATTWLEDIKYLLKHKSYILTSLGSTCVAFVAGALALWAPIYMYFSILIQPNPSSDAMISIVFGVITSVAGILGVLLGSFSANLLRRKTSRADPYVSAFGMLACAPCLYFALVLSRFNTATTFLLIFVAEVLLFLNWALVSDMTLYLVLPTRRSTASAFQILMSHALGDAGSPTLIGFMSDRIRESENQIGYMVDYSSLQHSLYMMCFICILGGAFFLYSALFIERDRQETLSIMQGYETIQDTEVEVKA